MSEKAIIVENLWKGYQLGSGKSGNLRETLSNLFSSSKKEKDTFWALQDINFTINKGEAVGIIGRNGAGKSTLLKILSRITAPTKGGFQLNGRVSSLLEVGTGFHPELTGRENIYLNGTILGMTRAEVKLKFDEIVAFSGIEKFIDTPVKRYSSGMYVRLAFAVAAHLEPEILIVDEVLAVGDAEFQKKCLGKMKDVSSNEGRTVLFVSHNLGAVAQLCTHGLLIESGKVKNNGEINSVINSYINASSTELIIDRQNISEWKNKNHFTSFSMLNEAKEISKEFKHDEKISLNITAFIPNFNPSIEIAISLYDRMKSRVFTIHEPLSLFEKKDNIYTLKISLQTGLLTPGSYSWLMCLNHRGVEMQDLQDGFYDFTIIDNGSPFNAYPEGSYGSVFANYKIENKIIN